MFSPDNFSDEAFSQELEGDIASECGKCGEIEKITVFSKNPRGVVIVKFSTNYASQECVRLMHGRFFGGKKLRCYYWDGSTDFSGEGCRLQESFLLWSYSTLRVYHYLHINYPS